MEHAELELAVESLCLGIIAESVRIPEHLRLALPAVAKSLGLDTESVLDASLWGRLNEYLTAM